MTQVKDTVELEKAMFPARVGQRLVVSRQGAEDARYIRTFCGNMWGWINTETGECVSSARVGYALQRGATARVYGVGE